jgi:hypothetical protein
LRHLDDGGEVEVLDRRPDRPRRTRRRLFLSEVRIELIELPQLAVGSPPGMTSEMAGEDELRIVRRAYAKQIMAADRQVTDTRIENAFAEVPREAFLGPGPWPILRFWINGYVATPSADPVYLYTNDIVGIAPERHLNNGQPSLHAHLLACAAARAARATANLSAIPMSPSCTETERPCRSTRPMSSMSMRGRPGRPMPGSTGSGMAAASCFR